MKQSLFTKTFFHWLPLGFAVTILTGMVYLGLQQSLRLGANAVPAQMTGDAVSMLKANETPAAIVGSGNVDLATSLTPFITIVDSKGTVLASNAKLNGVTPVPPKGVMTSADNVTDNRVTWQPQSGVRQAIVVKAFTGTTSGYVIAGRSLTETESVAGYLETMVAGFWLVVMIGSFLLTGFAHSISAKA